MHKLLVATNNAGKLKEYRELLSGIPLELLSLSDLGITVEVPETGDTYTENAVLKAKTYARLSGMPVLADDSGLEVRALGGEPGVASKRYGGEVATDEERNALLLERLASVSTPERQARFVCVIVVALPAGRVYISKGTVEGLIAERPRGVHGFGYDPIFYLPSLGKTMAELSFSEKNRVSHRAAAAKKAQKVLQRLIDECDGEG